jgi:hypothetical protein
MSSEIEGQSADLSLRVESTGTATIDARAVARLDALDFVNEVVDFPSELWAGLVIYPKPAVGMLPGAFSGRERQDELLAALDHSGGGDILYVESTLSPPKAGKKGKKWPSIVVFVFLDADKFARVYEMFRTAFLAPGSTYALEIENVQLKGTADEPLHRHFREWGKAHRPFIAAGDVEVAIRNVDGNYAHLITLVRILVFLAAVGSLSLLLQCIR